MIITSNTMSENVQRQCSPQKVGKTSRKPVPQEKLANLADRSSTSVLGRLVSQEIARAREEQAKEKTQPLHAVGQDAFVPPPDAVLDVMFARMSGVQASG